MKQTKPKTIFVILHIIASIAIMLCSQLVGSFVGNILSTNNAAVDNLIFTAVYIAVTLFAGLLYAKYVMHFNFEDIGVCRKAPQLKWICTGFCLPLAVTAFYVLFADGQIIRNDNETGMLFYVFNAIFYAGLSAGICEEFIFRGLIMRILERKWNSTVAVLLPSVLFAVMHMVNLRLNFIDMMLLLVAGTAVGVMFSLIALQSGTIWSGAIVHGLWNAIILGGVFIVESPDSGLSANFFCRYELLTDNVLLTGGRFGIESALPAIIGYCAVSIAAFVLLRRSKNKKSV